MVLNQSIKMLLVNGWVEAELADSRGQARKRRRRRENLPCSVGREGRQPCEISGKVVTGCFPRREIRNTAKLRAEETRKGRVSVTRLGTTGRDHEERKVKENEGGGGGKRREQEVSTRQDEPGAHAQGKCSPKTDCWRRSNPGETQAASIWGAQLEIIV